MTQARPGMASHMYNTRAGQADQGYTFPPVSRAQSHTYTFMVFTAFMVFAVSSAYVSVLHGFPMGTGCIALGEAGFFFRACACCCRF